MLPERYLERGVNAIARAFFKEEWSWEQFMNGHRGAGTLAGYFLVADGLTEDASSGPIQGMLDREWEANPTFAPIFAPMEAEAAAPQELDRLLAILAGTFASSGHVGHNVIYPTFALRAFRKRPELITRSRIDGIAIMARMYAGLNQPTGFPVPAAFASAAYSAWTLESYLRCVELFRGCQQGGIGHLLTYGQAVHDLHDLGYIELSRIAEAGYRDFVAQLLKGPTPKDLSRPQVYSPPTTPLHPELSSYWQSRPPGIMEATFGHETKYAYAMIKLCRQAQDPVLAEKAFAPLYGPRQPPPG